MAETNPKEFWRVRSRQAGWWADAGVFDTFAEAEKVASQRSRGTGVEHIVARDTPVVIFRPREPERVEINQAAEFDSDDPPPVPQHGSGEWLDHRYDNLMPRHLFGGQMVEVHLDGEACPTGAADEARVVDWAEVIRYRVVTP